MGSFAELVMAVDLRSDVPEPVLSTLVMAPVGEEGPPLPDPVFHDPGWDPHLFPAGADDDPLSHAWGAVLGMDMSGVAFAGQTGVSLMWNQWTVRWQLTVRSVWKIGTQEIAEMISWLGPWVCPDASPEDPQFVGHIKHEDAARPTLIWHDGRDLLFEGIGDVQP